MGRVEEAGKHGARKWIGGRHRDLLAALASGFVGALALGTSTYNVYLQRQQVRASVWPHVTMSSAFTDDGALSFVLRNRGVGPAQLKRFRVTVDGKPAEDWADMLKMLLRKDTLTYIPDTTELHEEVLTPGMELPLLKIPTFKDSQDIMQEAGSGRFSIEVCYCSTLDDCWALGGEGTKEVRGCPEDPRPFVAQSEKTGKWIHEYWHNIALGLDAGPPLTPGK